MLQKLLYLHISILLSVITYEVLPAQEPSVISWDVLADVTYSEQYDESLQAYWLVPEFGPQPRRFAGKEVVLMGYFIPFNLDSEFYVLSRFPYSNCFFCLP